MIPSNINPSWVQPHKNEVVVATRPQSNKYVKVTYDFKDGKWRDSQGKILEVSEWKRIK